MILYGRGSGQAVMGQAGRHVCPSCKEEADINATVVYKYFHIWYLLSFLTGREYFLVCDKCQAAVQVDEATAKAQCPNDNIPFLRRKGWMLVLAVIAFFIAVSSYNDWSTARKTRQYLANPVIGDLVVANMVRVEGSGFTADNPDIKKGIAYGGLLFMGIDEDEDRVFATTMRAYSTPKSFRDFRKEQGKDLQFDFENPVYLNEEAVEELRNAKVIIDVVRGQYSVPAFDAEEGDDEEDEDLPEPATTEI